MKKYYDILNESFDKYGIKDSFIEDELEPVDDISDWFLSPTEDSDDILLDEPELIYSDSDEDFDADDDISTSKRFAAMFGYEYNDEDIDDDLAEKISDEDKVDSDALRAIYRKSPSKLNKTDKELLDKYGLEYTEEKSLTEALKTVKFDPEKAEKFVSKYGDKLILAQDVYYSDIDDLDYFDDPQDVGFKIIGDEAYIPKGAELTIVDAGSDSWPIIEFNGEELDFAGDPFKVKIQIQESLTEAFDPIKEAIDHFRNDLGRDPEDIDEVINYMINMGDIEEPELDSEDKKSIEAYNSWYDELADKISDALQESLNEDVDSKKMVEIDWI